MSQKANQLILIIFLKFNIAFTLNKVKKDWTSRDGNYSLSAVRVY